MTGDIELDREALEKARAAWVIGKGRGSIEDAIRAYLAAAQPERKGAEAMRERAIGTINSRLSRANDCENLGVMDWETGACECSAENRGEACVCAERVEEAELLRDRIRALPLPTDKEPTP